MQQKPLKRTTSSSTKAQPPRQNGGIIYHIKKGHIMSKKMAMSFVSAVVLFIVWSAMAYAQRGYFAVGGEYGAFLLPLFVAAID